MYRRNQQQQYMQNNCCDKNTSVNNVGNSCCNNMQQGVPYDVCDKEHVCAIKNPVLGMAYVVNQKWNTVYEPCKALKAGTIFPELDLPFLGRSCGRR